MEETGEDKPEPLRAFMLAYLRGEAAPPKGWRSNPIRDARIAALVHIMRQLGFTTDEQCYAVIAKGLGWNTTERVRKARERGLGL